MHEVETTLTRSHDDAERLLADIVREHRPVLMAKMLRLTAGDPAWAEDALSTLSDRHRADPGSPRSIRHQSSSQGSGA
jgi:hypothetical protein